MNSDFSGPWKTTFATPIGELTLLASRRGITHLYWDGADLAPEIEAEEKGAPPFLADARKQLTEYFKKKRTKFDFPLDLKGTPFQLSVWNVLRKIPHGETWTFQRQAAYLGDAKKARAVGAANGKNPVAIVVPCHRVVGKNGHLTGFAGGLNVKQFLLEHEGLTLSLTGELY